jgi:membrane protein DedA with SNARE-associated domain
VSIGKLVSDVVAAAGCPAVFSLVALESIGIPLPGETALIVRTYVAFLAGTSKMRWPRFVAANAAGGILWAAIYTSVGYLAWAALKRLSLTSDLALGGIACLVIIGLVILLRRRMGDLTERAEKAYPGPLD